MRISKIVRIIFIAALFLSCALPAAAQYLGILQSAETMNQGTYKLMVAPIMLLGKDGADNETGFAARAGYAFTKNFDVEAKLGLFDQGTVFGVDGEYWIFRGIDKKSNIDFSLTGGFHMMSGKENNYDTNGFELTPQLSVHVSDKLELCGALNASFEKIKDVPPGVDDSFTTLHFVPGIEYGLSDTVDFEAEFGIGINDNTSNYISAGLTYYLH